MNKLLTLIKRVINRSAIILKDYYIDFSIQKRFIGDRRLESVDPGSGVYQWHNTSYDAFNKLFFTYVNIKKEDIIVDAGCADAKLFNYLLYKGLTNKMLGYEINKAAGALTKKRLSQYHNVEIILGDIFDNFPVNGTLFYLFNPFGENLMRLFIENIIKIQDNKPTIVYNNPVFAHLFNTQIFNVSIIKMHQYKHGDGKFALIGFKD